jgi:DNA-binding CsgD family transcriptional regulator
LNAAILGEFLDSIDGVAYATDAAGTIVACGAGNWSRFAAANGAPELGRPETVLGRNVLDITAGEDVRGAYRRLMTALSEARVNAVKFSYRCDGPGISRAMQMSITRLLGSGSTIGFLFQSTLIDEGARAPLPVLNSRFRRIVAHDSDDEALRLCSFCQRISTDARHRGDSAGWSYDAQIPAGEVRIVHAMCPRCEQRCATLAAERSGTPELSPRQRDVLAMLVRGHPNKTICAKLGMSPNTVKTHLRVIFRELQAANRTEAATEALRRWPDCAAHFEDRATPTR